MRVVVDSDSPRAEEAGQRAVLGRPGSRRIWVHYDAHSPRAEGAGDGRLGLVAK